jgi:hypothetical protein
MVTGTVPDADVAGVVYPDGRAIYRKYSLAPNSQSTPMCTTIADLQDQYSANSGYSLTYTDPADPDAVSISPTSGTAAGGTAVTITGTGLNSASCTVTIGGVACTLVRTASAGTTITCTTGAHGTGAVDVVVTTAEGTDTLVGAYTYT